MAFMSSQSRKNSWPSSAPSKKPEELERVQVNYQQIPAEFLQNRYLNKAENGDNRLEAPKEDDSTFLRL
jgi:hypothetical protein